LRILGRTEPEIAAFQETAQIMPETPIFAPIGGTVVQRKIGPGQYITSASSDPVFVIGDLSTVWLLAYVREADAPKVRIGQLVEFTVMAYPEQTLEGKLDYVAAALDPVTRRLLVRATIANPSASLKPEMFAKVTVFSDDGEMMLTVAREAIIYDGEVAKVWVAHEDRSLELRRVRAGPASANRIQVRDGLKLGEKVVTQGRHLFDRGAAGS
jgi:cobalt-zinc-cadmium efflux system membrane fusion protein